MLFPGAMNNEHDVTWAMNMSHEKKSVCQYWCVSHASGYVKQGMIEVSKQFTALSLYCLSDPVYNDFWYTSYFEL